MGSEAGPGYSGDVGGMNCRRVVGGKQFVGVRVVGWWGGACVGGVLMQPVAFGVRAEVSVYGREISCSQ